jgi:Rps23 Pro-64 3,4-dihydroxylase Tpa1-like proline 4-hydroxylase
MARKLFELNPDLDRLALADTFARQRRVQVRDLLTRDTAEEIRTILAQATPWGLAMQAGDAGGPQQVLSAELQTAPGKQRAQALMQATHEAAARGDYAFRYAQYSLVQSVQQGWDPEGPHQLLLEYLNAPEFIGFIREITGFAELVKADGQATLYAPQHFLGRHVDSHVAEGWKVAYVMNFTAGDWRPEWGGYLQFFDDEGDVVQAFRPRFNSLNLFAVPQPHAVSFVPPFAPLGRYAITGWFRDR